MAPNMDESIWKTQDITKKDGHWTVDGRPNVIVDPQFKENPSTNPDVLFFGLHVTMPVNSATAPHRHGGAAVAGTVIKGHVLTQIICDEGGKISDEEAHRSINIYGPGDTWYEPPGCHRVRSENAGDEEAAYVVNFVAEAETVEEKGMGVLMQFDADVDEANEKD